MNICFIQYNLTFGGAERKVCTLANYFVSLGHNVEIGLYGNMDIAYELDSRIKVTFINRKNLKYSNITEKIIFLYNYIMSLIFGLFSDKIKKHFRKKLLLLGPIKHFLVQRKDTVFITMMASCYISVMSVIDKYNLEFAKNKYIVMECINPKFGSIKKEKANKYYLMARMVVAMNEGIKNCFSEEVKSKTVVIPNPLRNDLVTPYFGSRNKNIVSFCRLSKQKNLPLLINAFNKLVKEFPEYKLEIYGNGKEKDNLLELIENLLINDKVFINSFDSQIHEKIKNSAMFVLSSDFEGQPNALMEAMAIGLPCISTDCDFGPRYMIKDHENGLLVPCNNVDALYNAMKEYIENPDLAKKCGKESIKVREEFAIEKIGDKWLGLINENIIC